MTDQNNNSDREFGIKDIIALIHWAINVVKSNFKVMLLFVFALTIMFAYVIRKFKKQSFEAKTSFVVKGNSGQAGGLMGMAAQFGFGASLDQKIVNKEQLLEIAKSRRVLKEVFLSPSNTKSELIIDDVMIELVDRYNWKPKFKDIDFSQGGFVQDSLISAAASFVNARWLSVRISKEDIISVIVNTRNTNLSYNLNNQIINVLTQYYLELYNTKDRNTFYRISERIDSIKSELMLAEQDLAESTDASIYSSNVKARLAQMRDKRRVEINNAIYIEAVKNLEIARFNMLNNESVLEVIDKPVYPLKENRPISFKMCIIFGLVISTFIVVTATLVLRYLVELYERNKPNGE